MTGDRFSDIAISYNVKKEERGLVENAPQILPEKIISLDRGSANGFVPYKKMSTKEEMFKDVKRLRTHYEPFLKNYAPKFDSHEERIELKNFKFALNGGEERDITIPYYWGPIGKNRSSYRTAFTLPEFNPNEKTIVLNFRGVDYIAEVFLNGEFIGRHEGFFAPFEFDATDFAKPGENELKVIVKNDNTMTVHTSVGGDNISGDKIYACTGPGWNESWSGWHHCPAGFGIYQSVYVDIRNKFAITDIFPRVNSKACEVWVDCNSYEISTKIPKFRISVYGQNFKETVFEDYVTIPKTSVSAGVGDTLTESVLFSKGQLGIGIHMKMGPGFNRYKIPIHIPNRKIWTQETPYLYQIQVSLIIEDKEVSTKSRQFGIRDFEQVTNTTERKGKFLLNGKEVHLRGANTMGFEQQDIMRGDFDQLIDDILIAKVCNMTFLRITQRPVQEEFYNYCDMLGLMIQTDLPLFGTVRINQYAEVIRQAGEMERLIRTHPCCVISSYINEPFPNASNIPNRMITRPMMSDMFDACDAIVSHENPDRVTKHVDGDYDPPSKKEPDSHCYTMWYNGHGLDMGMLHKGYWLDTAPNWYCGCGEFGAEAIDHKDVVMEMYPEGWRKEPFHPNNIQGAQTGRFHYFFYETPKDMDGWINESMRHQAFAAKIMTSSFRRNPIINSFAIHVFIDAWPAGWMKSILDCRRSPKDAYFVYRDCLSPVFCSFRTDRLTYFAGEEIKLESYISSDLGKMDKVSYMVQKDDEIIYSKTVDASDEQFQGYITFKAPEVSSREKIKVSMAAFKGTKMVHYATEEYELFPKEELIGFEQISYAEYDANREKYEKLAEEGKKVIIAPCDPGEYNVAGRKYTVTECGMSPLYFVSRDTGHKYTEGLVANDLKYLYDSKLNRLTPVIKATFESNEMDPIITSGNLSVGTDWHCVLAMAEIKLGKGSIIVNQLEIEDKKENPAIVKLMNNIVK